jgi:hypothetical protein
MGTFFSETSASSRPNGRRLCTLEGFALAIDPVLRRLLPAIVYGAAAAQAG